MFTEMMASGSSGSEPAFKTKTTSSVGTSSVTIASGLTVGQRYYMTISCGGASTDTTGATSAIGAVNEIKSNLSGCTKIKSGSYINGTGMATSRLWATSYCVIEATSTSLTSRLSTSPTAKPTIGVILMPI